MHMRLCARLLALTAIIILPATASEQAVNATRRIVEDQPFTLIYPNTMVATGGAGEPVTINHPSAPLQCNLVILPVEQTDWTPQGALDDLHTEAVTAQWTESFPGFALTGQSITAYQSGEALRYEGTSTDSDMGLPITLIHTETVASGRGYVLDCVYATEVAENAAPIVEFIIANFSTRSDGECCIGVQRTDEQVLVAPE